LIEKLAMDELPIVAKKQVKEIVLKFLLPISQYSVILQCVIELIASAPARPRQPMIATFQ
jgi:hypothetical protein